MVADRATAHPRVTMDQIAAARMYRAENGKVIATAMPIVQDLSYAKPTHRLGC